MDISLKKNHVTLGLLVICFVLLIYFFKLSTGFREHGIIQTYYPLLANGFIHGHLYLPIMSSDKLLHLSNPYDPSQNICCRYMFDASYYKGKFYLYFGPLPLILFIPFRFLTGNALPTLRQNFKNGQSPVIQMNTP